MAKSLIDLKILQTPLAPHASGLWPPRNSFIKYLASKDDYCSAMEPSQIALARPGKLAPAVMTPEPDDLWSRRSLSFTFGNPDLALHFPMAQQP